MKKYVNGQYVEMTPAEIAESNAAIEEIEREYWLGTSYDDLVNTEIRKKYTASQEFAILRQRDDKPDEYSAYYWHCEWCKSYVKEQLAKYS